MVSNSWESQADALQNSSIYHITLNSDLQYSSLYLGSANHVYEAVVRDKYEAGWAGVGSSFRITNGLPYKQIAKEIPRGTNLLPYESKM